MLKRIESTLDSREVAKMIEKEHKAVMRDIRRLENWSSGQLISGHTVTGNT